MVEGKAVTDTERLENIQATFSQKDIRTIYAFEKLIGGGHFGSVRIAHRITDPQIKYAVKSILLENVKENVKFLEEELMILQKVDHPNIVKFHESYMDHRYVHIVMELALGGELFEKIVELQSFPEVKAADLMRQIVSAILHMHEKGVCHRDIKPENFMFSDKGKDSELKLIDFGLSKRFGKNESGVPGGDFMHSIVGTPYYVAPEVLEGNYGFQCDVWSLGIIFYILLCGYPPFEGDNNKEIFKRVMTQEVEFDPAEWSHISQEAKNLILKMLQRDQNKRIHLSDVIKDGWFDKMNSIRKETQDPVQNQEIMTRLRNFRAPKRL
jgi:calcium-dependent protein kinase